MVSCHPHHQTARRPRHCYVLLSTEEARIYDTRKLHHEAREMQAAAGSFPKAIGTRSLNLSATSFARKSPPLPGSGCVAQGLFSSPP